jgi:TonB family protein
VTAPPPPLPNLPPPPPEEPDAGEPDKVVKRGGFTRCNGDVDRVAVRRFTQQNSGSLRRCYERRLKQNNTLAGRLEVGLTVGSGGQVQGARIVADSVRDPDVAACVRQAVSGWRQPAPSGGCVNVTFPISFQPHAGD